MSEPLGVEELARLRRKVYDHGLDRADALALLDEVDRLTGELESREHKGSMWVSKAAFDRVTEALEAAKFKVRFQTEEVAREMHRAERAEADLAAAREAIEVLHGDVERHRNRRNEAQDALADEKRRHAELRAGVEALADAWEGSHAVGGNLAASLRALLDTATEETL